MKIKIATSRQKKIMTSLGSFASSTVIVCEQLGSRGKPVRDFFRASTDYYENDLNWVDTETGETRLRLKEDGHLQISQDVEFYDGQDINTSTKRFSIGLDSGGNFVIRDEIQGVDRLKIDASGNILGIRQQDVPDLKSDLTSRQEVLKVNGVPINTAVLNTFHIASGGEDGNPANSLLTAKAIEDWFEELQNSLVMIMPGQSGPAYRVGMISHTSPSAVNLPSCLAVSNFVNTTLKNFEGSLTHTLKCNELYVGATKLSHISVDFNGESVPVLVVDNMSILRCVDMQISVNNQYVQIGAYLMTRASSISPSFTGTVNLPSSQDVYVDSTSLESILNGKQDSLTFDSEPILGSGNVLTSGVIKTHLDSIDITTSTLQAQITNNIVQFDDSPTESSSNVVRSGGLHTYLQGMLSNLHPLTPVDSSVSESSSNLVSSGAVYNHVETTLSNYTGSSTLNFQVASLQSNYLLCDNFAIKSENFDFALGIGALVHFYLKASSTTYYLSAEATASGSLIPWRVGKLYLNRFQTSSDPDIDLANSFELTKEWAESVLTISQATLQYHPLTTVDTVPADSQNLITSKAVFDANQGIQATMLTKTSEAALRSVGYRKESEIRTTLDTVFQPLGSYHPNTAVDTTPVLNSSNLVTSGGVKASIEQAKSAVRGCDFIQFTNVFDDLVNNGDGSTDLPQDGIPEDGDFRRYPGFDTSSSLNTNQLIYTLSSDRVTIYEDGFYKITVHMTFYSQVQRASVAIRLGKNEIREGPIGMHGYIRANNLNADIGNSKASSVTLSHIVSISANDELGVYTARHGVAGEVQTPASYSQFTIERMSDVRPQYTFLVTRSSIGDYVITFDRTLPNGAYTLLLSVETSSAQFSTGTDATHLDDYMIAYENKNTSGFNVYIREQDDGNAQGVPRDCTFSFACILDGHIFCHGEYVHTP